MTEEEKVLFEPYERKIRNQQNELCKLYEELEYMRKVLHRKNLDGMRQCRRRKEQREEIANLKAQLKEEEDIATVAYIQGANHGSVMYRNARDGWKKKAEELDKKVVQAREIIKEYMRFETIIGTCAFYSEEYEKTKKKAEQFLKEE